MIDKNTTKRYLADVKSALKQEKAYQRSVVKRLNADIQDYISENPDATDADFLACFGNPGDYAAEYMTTMPLGEQKARLSAKKRVIIIVAAGVVAALMLWGISLVSFLLDTHTTHNGYFDIEIISQYGDLP